VYAGGVSFLNLHPGLRLSAIGGVVFIASLLTLLVAPPAVSVAGMIIGGIGVWSGFLWTLFAWYQPEAGPTPRDGSADDAAST
jgi:hypothetical protein